MSGLSGSGFAEKDSRDGAMILEFSTTHIRGWVSGICGCAQFFSRLISGEFGVYSLVPLDLFSCVMIVDETIHLGRCVQLVARRFTVVRDSQRFGFTLRSLVSCFSIVMTRVTDFRGWTIKSQGKSRSGAGDEI